MRLHPSTGLQKCIQQYQAGRFPQVISAWLEGQPPERHHPALQDAVEMLAQRLEQQGLL
ncbi:hypothetical protein D3C77_681430 [compost metagenome]